MRWGEITNTGTDCVKTNILLLLPDKNVKSELSADKNKIII